MNNIKTKRISSLISKELSEIFHNEIKDEVIKKITIIDAEVSNDLGFCKVYYTLPKDSNKDLVETELKKASKFLRMELASRVDLRSVPVLKFVYDKSIEYGNHIDDILNKINLEK